jgi:hypothetical protein
MATSKKFASYGITIVGDDQYRFAVELTLSRIEASYTGKALLSAIKMTEKAIQIIPWPDETICNADASPKDYRAATPSNQYPLAYDNVKQNYTYQPMGEPSRLRSMFHLPLEPAQGTGMGSDGIVRFTPTMWGFGAKGDCAQYVGGSGASPSQILFHELAHAYRSARGTFYARPTIGTGSGYDNMEEFFAIVLSNVLATDPTFSTANRTLRADHSAFLPLAANLSTSKSFVASIPNRNKMREIAIAEPLLLHQLRGSKSTFNPFAEPLM